MNIRNIKKRAVSAVRSALNNRAYRQNKAAKEFVAEHRCPALTKEEKREIDRYWAQYHVKYRNYDWHRMFYTVTGIRDPRFIPQPFAEKVLYPYYKKLSFSSAYADKNIYSTFLPELRFPTVIGKRMNSRYYDAEDRCYGSSVTDAFVERVYNAFLENNENGKIKEIILKISIESSFGKGVRKLTVDSKETMSRILREDQSENYVLQMAVQQHPVFAQLNEDSVNIIRITTWRKDEEVYIFSPCVRFGIKGSHTDVAFRNGKEILNVLKIDPTGRLSDRYVTLEGEHIALPDGCEKQIPQWDEIVRTVKAAALKLKYFDIVAWDITVDDHGQVVFIEYNLNMPGTLIYQFAHGPLAGDHTDELLAFLKDKKNIKFIPTCIRSGK